MAAGPAFPRAPEPDREVRSDQPGCDDRERACLRGDEPSRAAQAGRLVLVAGGSGGQESASRRGLDRGARALRPGAARPLRARRAGHRVTRRAVSWPQKVAELELTCTKGDRRVYALEGVGILRLEGVFSRAATAEADGTRWRFARSGFWRRSMT